MIIQMLLGGFLAAAGQINGTFIGDSHSTVRYGLFQKLFDPQSDQEMARLRFTDGQGVCGAGIHYFTRGNLRTRCGYMKIHPSGNVYQKTGRSKKLVSMMRSLTDVVFVQLGGNHWANPNAAGPLAQKLANQILDRGKSCIWIGTAASNPNRCQTVNRDRKRIHQVVSHALANLNRRDGKTCHYINSYSKTLRIRGEGIGSARDCRHYNGKGYRQWANVIRPEVVSLIRKIR